MGNDENFMKEASKLSFELRKKIKSQNILKYIFSVLNQKKKLNMVIYNKKYQRILGFNINYYTLISGKEYIDLKKGKGKELKLNTNLTLFEGEYLNNKRNGKGIEYNNNGPIKFEGEYLKGKRNGKGEEYDVNGISKFEGEYLKGIKIEGKGYDENYNIIFILEKNGKLKEYYKNGNIKFSGEFF